MRLLTFALAVLLALSGCAARQATLTRQIGRHTMPSPMVRGTIAGKTAYWVLDTGSSYHVISSWLTRRLGLPTTKVDNPGFDPAGNPYSIERLDHPDLTLEGWGKLPDRPIFVVTTPDEFEQLGIGGLLSPQLLVDGDDALVLDLVTNRMRETSFDEGVASLGTRGALLTQHPTRLCRQSDGSIEAVLHIATASVDGQDVDLLVDTGAQQSSVGVKSRVGEMLMARAGGGERDLLGAFGANKARVVDDVEVKLGEWAVRASINLQPIRGSPTCPFDGLLGMDVLGKCALVVGHKRLAGRCSR